MPCIKMSINNFSKRQFLETSYISVSVCSKTFLRLCNNNKCKDYI